MHFYRKIISRSVYHVRLSARIHTGYIKNTLINIKAGSSHKNRVKKVHMNMSEIHSFLSLKNRLRWFIFDIWG